MIIQRSLLPCILVIFFTGYSSAVSAMGNVSGYYNNRVQVHCHNFAHNANKVKSNPKESQQFLDIIRDFAGEGAFINDYVNQIGKGYCQNGPNFHMSLFKPDWASKTGYLSMLDKTGFTIHETAHYFSRYALLSDKHYLDKSLSNQNIMVSNPVPRITTVYLKEQGIQHIIHTPTFPSIKITPYIKDRSLLNGERYKQYISNKGRVPGGSHTQPHGVYALLDEFHAYYYSQLVVSNIVKRIPVEKRKLYVDIPGYKGAYGLVGVGSNYLSFVEFKTYILTYFRLAKDQYPDIYKQLMQNKLLLKMFIHIDEKFEKSVAEYLKHSPVDNDKEYKGYLAELNRPENIKMMKLLREKAGV